MDGFIRPKISWQEWEREPLNVVPKVVMAIAGHIEPVDMNQEQRSLVFASIYLGSGLKQHGTIFINALQANDDGTVDDSYFKFIPEALLSIGAESHKEIFDRAVKRWKAKPRVYSRLRVSDSDELAAWAREVFDPVCDEFLDLDEEAFMVRPTLASHIVDFLREHRKEFVEIVEK
jgi:hypothetical protein